MFCYVRPKLEGGPRIEGQGLRWTAITFHIQGQMHPFAHTLSQGSFVRHIVGVKCKRTISEDTVLSERYFLDF